MKKSYKLVSKVLSLFILIFVNYSFSLAQEDSTKFVECEFLGPSPKVRVYPNWMISNKINYSRKIAEEQTGGRSKTTVLGTSVDVSRKIKGNFYGGVGIGFELNREKLQIEELRYISTSSGFINYSNNIDYTKNVYSISPQVNVEYIRKVANKLYMSLNAYAKFNIESAHVKYNKTEPDRIDNNLGPVVVGSPYGIIRGRDYKDGYYSSLPTVTYDLNKAENKRTSIEAGISPYIRWSFSKYFGAQINLGALYYYDQLSDKANYSNPAFKRSESKSVNLDLSPKSWRLGAYLYF